MRFFSQSQNNALRLHRIDRSGHGGGAALQVPEPHVGHCAVPVHELHDANGGADHPGVRAWHVHRRHTLWWLLRTWYQGAFDKNS
ncbi:MAG TPA: hypothetical protein VIJ25_05820 [Methylococcales bacterium]